MSMAATAATPQERSRLGKALVAYFPLIIFLALLIFLGIRAPSFLEPTTIVLILKQSLPTLVVSLGLAVVVMAGGDDVVSGGIDLSVPSTAILAAAIIAEQVTNQGTFIVPALALGLAAALVVGVINAALVVRIGMTPLLATLAMSTAIVGIVKVITSSRRINVTDPFVIYFRDADIAGIPVAILVALVFFLGFYFLIHRTRWGMNLQAVGGNRDAAEVSGIAPGKFIGWSFVIAAFAGGLASIFVLARGSGSSPGTEENLLIEMVLATFLGAAFSPRRVVTVWGAVLGAVLVAALSVGFASIGVNIFWTGCIKGGLILIVVASAALSGKANR